MIRRPRRRFRLFRAAAGVLAAALLSILPSRAAAWGSLGHRTIAAQYGASLPDGLQALRANDQWIYDHVMDPDTRKSTIPTEGYRHFIDIDAYPEYAGGTLSHDRAVLEAAHGAAQVQLWGLVPWAIGEVVDSMSVAMSNGDWTKVRYWTADLCHYTGDIHQPLHCTKNYDGQLSGNNGIHARYESTMLNNNAAALVLTPGTAVDYPNPVDAAFVVATSSQQSVAAVLTADSEAKAAAGGSTTSGAYYSGLWSRTSALTLARLSAAATATASFVYTAWLRAGSPPPPGSLIGVPGAEDAVAALSLTAGPVPASTSLTLSFVLPDAGPVTCELIDVRGRRALRLDAGARPAGSGRVVLPLTGDNGGPLVPGIYFARLRHGAAVAETRVVVLR